VEAEHIGVDCASQLCRALRERHFYLWMAGVFVADRIRRFPPTTGARRQRTFHGPPILHIMRAAFQLTLVYFMQPHGSHRGTRPPRAWGLAE